MHLCDFPAGEALPARDPALEEAMATARETVRLGLGARGQAKIKVRQPLREAVVVADGRERAAIERLADVVREELNVRSVRFVAARGGAGQLRRQAQLPHASARCSARTCRCAAEAIAALDPARVAATVRDGGQLGISVGEREHTLTADDLLLTLRAPDGYSVEREGTHAVALDLTIDEDLRREGRAREIVHAVQNARKSAGLAVEDRIVLSLSGDPLLLEAAGAHREYLAGETLAVGLTLDGGTAASASGSTASGPRSTASTSRSRSPRAPSRAPAPNAGATRRRTASAPNCRSRASAAASVSTRPATTGSGSA